MSQILTIDQKAIQVLNELLESELGDYSQFKWEIKIEDDSDERVYLDAKIFNDLTEKTDTIGFYYNIKEDDLYVDMYDGQYEMVRSFDYQVKYFWIRFDLWN